MIDGLVTGKLHGKPVERTGQNGRPYVIAKVLAPNGEGEAHIVNVITLSMAWEIACSSLMMVMC